MAPWPLSIFSFLARSQKRAAACANHSYFREAHQPRINGMASANRPLLLTAHRYAGEMMES
jgi:hypothetical protein